jgi:hypothetical protein
MHTPAAPVQYLRNLGTTDDDASAYLDDAITVLSLAVQQDPAYNPAHLNLAIAYLYQGKPHQARAALSDLRKQANRNTLVDIFDAIALYEQSDAEIDLWPAAIKKLELRLKQQRDSAVTVYNLARLYALRPRPAEAGHYWTQLLKAREELPTQILTEVCTKQPKAKQLACRKINQETAKPVPWQWPYAKEQMLLDTQTRQSLLNNWRVTEFDWATASLHGFIHQSPNKRSELLEVSQFVQMQVMRVEQPPVPAFALNQLQSYCPYPLAKSTLEAAEIWSCDQWAVYVVNQTVVEIWRHAK